MSRPFAEQLARLQSEIHGGGSPAPPAVDPHSAAQQLSAYIALIDEYGRRINLVGCRDRTFMETDLVIGSLQILRTGLPRGGLVDIGSGAGFPGIPLAIVLPSLVVTLVEVRKKRAAFLDRVRLELGLSSRVRVLQEDADLLEIDPFDWAVSRAFRPPARWLALAARLVRPGGSVGVYAKRKAWATAKVPHDLAVMAAEADPTAPERVVVRLEKVSPRGNVAGR